MKKCAIIHLTIALLAAAIFGIFFLCLVENGAEFILVLGCILGIITIVTSALAAIHDIKEYIRDNFEKRKNF